MNTHHLYLLAPGASAEDIRRFYTQALGLSECEKPPSLAHIAVLWFAAGPIKFHVGHPKAGIVGDGHTALSVPNVEAARQHIASLGYAVDDTVIPMGYDRFYARDPWGNQFEILPEGLP
jgi:catechol 2,3-dioxygenase-like lactoylglutathione lyase family enzyme